VASLFLIPGVIGLYLSHIFGKIYIALAMVFVLLKLTDTVPMLWFGTVSVLSAVGTPLWILLCSFIILIISVLLIKIAGSIESLLCN